MTGKIKIVGAVVDTQQLILYKQSGDRVYIEQGDPRIRAIIDQVMPILNAGGVAEIDLEANNEYANFEKKTGGLVRFFRVAKKVVSHLFGSDADREDPVKPQQAGHIPAPVSPAAPTTATIDEIMAHATPVVSEGFMESETKPDDTMVAVVGEGKNAKVVPGVEALKPQLAHSNKLGSTIGVENLIKRLSKVVEKRGHSVQDVMRFMELGDLPVADDGSIIAYKILKKRPNSTNLPIEEGLFYDCHSGKVPQRVGSYVCVDEKLVDRNRRNECSNGLHIARRGYLGSFPGDVCVLTKIAPEDVVTVPHNDPNKVRVCGYHILGLIPSSEFANLKANRPMTESSECRRLLDEAISGKHVERLEEVKITQQMGGGVVVTPLIGAKTGKPIRPEIVDKKRTEAVEALAPTKDQDISPIAVALDDKTVVEEAKEASFADPKAIGKKVIEQKSLGQPSRQTLAAELAGRMTNGDLPASERKNAAEALVSLKKRAKISYAALGLSEAQVKTMDQILKGNDPLTAEQQALLKPKLKPQPEPELPAQKAAPVLSRKQIAANLVGTMNKGIVVHARINAAKELIELKKKSRQSWEALGVSDQDAKRALDLSDTETPPPAPPPPQAKKQEKKAKAGKKPKRHTPKAVTTTPVVVSKPAETTKDGPRQLKAKSLYSMMTDRNWSEPRRKGAAQDLLDFKKKSKVGWTALGLPQDMSKQIEALLSSK